MIHMTRRDVLRGATAAGLAASFGRVAVAGALPLQVTTRTLEVRGKAAKVFAILGPNGKPGLALMAGQPFTVDLSNATDVATLIHWHGLTPPMGQDGVPGMGQEPLAPGGRLSYDFANRRIGTFWMHSHVGLQEQRMMAAPLIVHEASEAAADEQNHVVMLHDFTFRDPDEILAELKAGGGGHAAHMAMDHSKMDMSKMDMSQMPAMLNDVSFDAYLANDRTLDDPEVVAVAKGGRLRLRIINGAAASNMWVDLGALEGELIAVDGNPVEPVRGSVFPLAIAQRADIRLELPKEGGAWPVLFRPEGVTQRTGIVLATPGATIPKFASEADAASPALDLAFEAQLKAADGPAPEPVVRTEMLMLTGGEKNYEWGLNGKPSMHDTLFSVRSGQRIAVMLHNMTAMSHPMHLHGHVFRVAAINGTPVAGALRDTILVPPMQQVTIEFDADNPGTWPLHCHHMYHMNSGMMGVVSYVSAA